MASADRAETVRHEAGSGAAVEIESVPCCPGRLGSPTCRLYIITLYPSGEWTGIKCCLYIRTLSQLPLFSSFLLFPFFCFFSEHAFPQDTVTPPFSNTLSHADKPQNRLLHHPPRALPCHCHHHGSQIPTAQQNIQRFDVTEQYQVCIRRAER